MLRPRGSPGSQRASTLRAQGLRLPPAPLLLPPGQGGREGVGCWLPGGLAPSSSPGISRHPPHPRVIASLPVGLSQPFSPWVCSILPMEVLPSSQGVVSLFFPVDLFPSHLWDYPSPPTCGVTSTFLPHGFSPSSPWGYNRHPTGLSLSILLPGTLIPAPRTGHTSGTGIVPAGSVAPGCSGRWSPPAGAAPGSGWGRSGTEGHRWPWAPARL